MTKRIITAILLIAIFGAMLHWLPLWVFSIFCQLLLFAAFGEWWKLASNDDVKNGIAATLFIALTLPSLFGIVGFADFGSRQAITTWENLVLAIAIIFWIFITPWLFRKKTKVASGWTGVFLGAFTFAAAFVGVARILNYSLAAFLVCIAIPVITDIFSFLVGKAFGRIKFSVISPNKTIEGAFGGVLISSIITGYLVFEFVGLNLAFAIAISVIVSCVSIAGDLFYSLAKRWAHVKNSGNIFPGHGGLLDRFDSHIASLPVFAALIGIVL